MLGDTKRRPDEMNPRDFAESEKMITICEVDDSEIQDGGN